MPSRMPCVRILLDENLPRRLKGLLPAEVEAVTVQERGWGSIQNGELLRLTQDEFDVFLTVDRGIPHQQDLSRLSLAVIILEARGNKFADLAPLMGPVTEALVRARPGEGIRITG